jgi:catechol 2,3-dioxygenase-like lactoylglutathione lyase family enzyme
LPITASAVSLNVVDPSASGAFARGHLGFTEEMSDDGFVALSRPDAGFNLIFLRTGLETLKPDSLRDQDAEGILIVFVVDDVDGECARLEREGVAITTPLQTEPWGERFFQVSDPNGVIVQFVQWVG